ncbi:M15 family metallopeptidase [Sporolactobacillus sp. Y61]|uniref:M15 family metallopeptidase n=1 Tax=Sporolactobacillus sp. Y61 TaxID=3160863 RepID=A0AAU8IHP5_9BACL
MKLKRFMGMTAALLLSLSACTTAPQSHQEPDHASQSAEKSAENRSSQSQEASPSTQDHEMSAMNQKGIHVVADPDSSLVLVNKYFKLPDSYVPKNLVDARVPFIFSGKSEKRKMRQEAAHALEHMFAAAEKEGIRLTGVSAYRSHRTQVSLFNYYVNKDGEKKALTYSARPGTSEHETGLSIDVSGRNGQYAATEAFGRTREAAWLTQHAHEYGFIIRYPKGKESITGYEYEAWHLRYVGRSAATTIFKRGLALEEYLGDVPVSK